MITFEHPFLYMMYLNNKIINTWILDRCSCSSAFITCHLYCHISLSIINGSSSSTMCTSPWCSTRLTFSTVTSSTNTYLLKLYSLLWSLNTIHKRNIHLNMNISSFHSSFSFSSHVKKRCKITKYRFIKFEFLSSPSSSSLSKETAVCWKRILSSSLWLFISCHSHLIIYPSFIFVW